MHKMRTFIILDLFCYCLVLLPLACLVCYRITRESSFGFILVSVREVWVRIFRAIHPVPEYKTVKFYRCDVYLYVCVNFASCRCYMLSYMWIIRLKIGFGLTALQFFLLPPEIGRVLKFCRSPIDADADIIPLITFKRVRSWVEN